jgi:hypothetical protein
MRAATPDEILSIIQTWITRFVSLALLVLIAVAVIGFYGGRVPMVPRVDATPLAWICGAFWFWRGGRI